MGYHLHFYKPLTLNGQEIRDLFIKDIEAKFKKYIEPYIETGRFDKNGNILELNHLDIKLTPEYYKHRAILNRDLLSKFQSVSSIYELKDSFIYAYLMFSTSFESNTGIYLVYENGKYYQQMPYFYKVFIDNDENRLYEDLFTDLQSTLDYLKNQGYNDEELTYVVDFFNNNPEGYAGI